LRCHDFPALLVVGVVVHQQRNKITRRTVVFVVERGVDIYATRALASGSGIDSGSSNK
jgi:hypothetical protein